MRRLRKVLLEHRPRLSTTALVPLSIYSEPTSHHGIGKKQVRGLIFVGKKQACTPGQEGLQSRSG